ncbi:hypothetical protein GQ44DRAFT_749270 [Phaeosphaeriaceae sp. PMI808]|nr:hypothetical protein GQ44DRAFT_749270 [Phaeosphaeriaceae sp. PMI808]
MGGLVRRYEQLTEHDAERAQFTTGLIQLVENLSQQIQELDTLVKNKDELTQQLYRDNYNCDQLLLRAQTAMNGNPFVTILIDGNDIMFTDKLLSERETGGRAAASQLYSEVQRYIDTKDVPSNSRIVCRIFTDIRGLGNALFNKGITYEAGDFERFVQGFNSEKPLFEFVDVGTDKDSARKKILESFKLYTQIYQCRHVLFGCWPVDGYACALNEFSNRFEFITKIVLLEGVPLNNLVNDKLYMTKAFPGLLRETKIDLDVSPASTPSPPMTLDSSTVALRNYNMFSGLPSRFPAAARETSVISSPGPSRASPAVSNRPSRTPSASSDGFALVSRSTNSWAARAAAPPPASTAGPAYIPSNREEVVSRNRLGQRIDPPVSNYDKPEVDRIKALKLCNVHYLRGDCAYNTNCAHSHAQRLTPSEIATLRLVARMAPCVSGSACNDSKCLYGHRCAAPPSRNQAATGSKSCIFGENCKFPLELHDIDTNVVRTLVLRG